MHWIFFIPTCIHFSDGNLLLSILTRSWTYTDKINELRLTEDFGLNLAVQCIRAWVGLFLMIYSLYYILNMKKNGYSAMWQASHILSSNI